MKFLSPQFAYLLARGEARQNLKALLQYLGLLVAIIGLFAVLFHVIMAQVEGQDHTWLTGLYWTLTVMTTLGFGDITFHSDLGRIFTIVVLLTGLVMLLIVLPFTFIRYFYAPWLEAQIRTRAPQELPPDQAGHVILCGHDAVAEALIPRLDLAGIDHVTIEPDAARASAMLDENVRVLAGDVEDVRTYRSARASAARLVLANLTDAINTNITVTVREAAPSVPIAALVEDVDAEDVIQLAGADHVLLVKERLGEHLASRVASGTIRAYEVGRIGPLRIAELPVHGTLLAGRTLRDTRLRTRTGLTVVGTWERGRLLPSTPDTLLSEYAVAVVAGTESQIAALDALVVSARTAAGSVLVIGGGRVGSAALRTLVGRGVPVSVIERNPAFRTRLEGLANEVFIGDAADRTIIERGGIATAPSVVITTHDDAVNIFLSVYCRKLNPDTRIVSRISRERNLEAVHRAGADYVLSHATLAAGHLMSILLGHEVAVLGEGADVYTVPVPASLHGLTLAESGIGAETGLSVIAITREGTFSTHLDADTRLEAGADLVMVGARGQFAAFHRRHAAGRPAGGRS
ncbi:MAG: NAD-binding protein [Deltaproteobacteria bacterium]|nr:NAD-binding protein [Deltaproteobacteria bacterium]